MQADRNSLTVELFYFTHLILVTMFVHHLFIYLT